MKKLVNGKVVNIENIDLFIKAAEDTAVSRTAVSITSEGIKGKIDSPLLQEYIYLYNIFYKSMPFPLYAIEDDIKYATLGQFISKFGQPTNMWVNHGLYILIDKKSKMAVYFVNNTWSIVYVNETQEDNTGLDKYENNTGYKDYKWLLDKILNEESTATYYKDMMPKFVEACNNQPMILKWELENILTFGNIPKQTEFRSNRIIDIDNGKEYLIDIYFAGYKETEEKSIVWNFIDDIDTVQKKKIKTYKYDIYEKEIGVNGVGVKDNKINKSNLIGALGLFLNLCSIKNNTDSNYFSDFKGIIVGNHMIYTINDTIYHGRKNKTSEHKVVADKVELYGYDRGMIYYTKYKQITKKVKQETLYSYNLTDNVKRLCKIKYIY